MVPLCSAFDRALDAKGVPHISSSKARSSGARPSGRCAASVIPAQGKQWAAGSCCCFVARHLYVLFVLPNTALKPTATAPTVSANE